MNPRPRREPFELAREELHVELLARNAFRAVLLGAVAFVLACVSVLAR